MANFKVKTIYTLNGRAPDSRDVWDKNNVGINVGRIDIPESAMVEVEGYSKVEYQVKLSDGTMEVFENFAAVISSWNGVIESKRGSGFMTVFINRPSNDTLGMTQIDVRKEWEDADPEPEAISVNDLTDISTRGLRLIKSGNTFGLGGLASRSTWDEAAESNDTCFVSARDVNPESMGQYVMGFSVARASGYAFQLGGRRDKIWFRFRDAGETGEWVELKAGGSSFDPTPLNNRISKLEYNDKTTQDTIRALEARLKALESPAS